jgi:predicted transposase YdaD
MLGRIISTNLKLSHLSSLGISILQFILIGAKKAPKQVQSLIEQTHQQVVDPNNQRNVIELIEKIIIYKFTHHGTALRWRQSIMLGVHALKQLYEIDDSQWLGETISLLRNHQFQQLDLEHLIEELEDLGKEKKNAVASLLEQVIRHLLFLQYWSKEAEYKTTYWQE